MTVVSTTDDLPTLNVYDVINDNDGVEALDDATGDDDKYELRNKDEGDGNKVMLD